MLLELANHNRTDHAHVKMLSLSSDTLLTIQVVCRVNTIGEYFMCFVLKGGSNGSVYHDHRRL